MTTLTLEAPAATARIGQELRPGVFALQVRADVVLALICSNPHTPFAVWRYESGVLLAGDYHTDLPAALAAFDQRDS